VAKLKKLEDLNGREEYMFYCPGCELHHGVWTGAGPGPVWQFNGSMAAPTFSPSIRVRMGPKCNPATGLRLPGASDQICHSFVMDGKIQFLSDCTHRLAGQTVELPEVDE